MEPMTIDSAASCSGLRVSYAVPRNPSDGLFVFVHSERAAT